MDTTTMEDTIHDGQHPQVSWAESARLLLDEGRFEHPMDTHRARAETPARRNRFWTTGNARRLWTAVKKELALSVRGDYNGPALALVTAARKKEAGSPQSGAVVVLAIARACGGWHVSGTHQGEAGVADVVTAMNRNHAMEEARC